MRGALFLDRDGTIITDEHYLNDPERVRLLPGAAAAIMRANVHGVPVVVITNQSGIGRGIISQEQYEAVAARVIGAFEAEGARIDGVYYCADGPDVLSGCRKPALTMYLQAAADLGLDMARSAYIGDKWRDVQPALTAGGLGILIPDAGTSPEDVERAVLLAHTAPDIEQAVTQALVWMRAAD